MAGRTFRVCTGGSVPTAHQLAMLSHSLAQLCPAVGEWYGKSVGKRQEVQCIVPAQSADVKRVGFDGVFLLFDLASRSSFDRLSLSTFLACPVVLVGIRFASRAWDRLVSTADAEALCQKYPSAGYVELDLETGENAPASLALLLKLMLEKQVASRPLYTRNGGLESFNAVHLQHASVKFSQSLAPLRPSVGNLEIERPREYVLVFQPGTLGAAVWMGGSLAAVEKFVRGANIDDSWNAYGDTALHFAAFLDNLPLVEFLLSRGASARIRNTLGQTPLHIAAEFASVAVCQALVESGCEDILALDDTEMSPLYYAACSNRLAVLKYLYGTLTSVLALSEGDLKAEWHRVSLLLAASNCGAPFFGLVERWRDGKGMCSDALRVAASFGNVVSLEALLDHASDEDLRQGFVEAASGGHLNLLKLLWGSSSFRALETMSAPSPPAHSFCSMMHAALVQAMFQGHNHVAVWLINQEDQYFLLGLKQAPRICHALIKAVEFGMSVSVVSRLLAFGVDVNSVGPSGMTPILTAAAHGRLRLLHLLIESGGGLFARDARDYGALHHACGNDDMDVLTSLLDLGLNPNLHNRNGESPLMVAVGQGNENAVRLVISHLGCRPPRDPLGTLKIWPKGPYMQVVLELREEDFQMRQQQGHSGEGRQSPFHCVTGTYMGINVRGYRYTPPVNLKELANTLSVLCHLRHPNLESLLGVCSDGAAYTLLVEVPGSDTSFCWLDSAVGLDWSPGAIVLLLKPLVRALDEMHREGAGKPMIYHRRISSASVMLNTKRGPILCGFSEAVASSAQSRKYESGSVGVMGWRAPECYNGAPFDTKADVFGFASLLYELLEGKFPFSDVPLFDVPRLILEGKRPPVHASSSSAKSSFLLEVLEMCWAQNPDDRPSFRQLRQMFDEIEDEDTAQEHLEKVFARALVKGNNRNESASSPHSHRFISLDSAAPKISHACVVLDDVFVNKVPLVSESVTTVRAKVDLVECLVREVPLSLVKVRRVPLCQMRVQDIANLCSPKKESSKKPGAKNVLPVLFLDQEDYRIRLYMPPFDYILFDRIRYMANERRQHWSPEEVRSMALQIASGISFLCTADPPIHHCFSDRDVFVTEKAGQTHLMVGGFGLIQLLTAKRKSSMLGDRGFVDATLLSADSHLYNTVSDRNHRLASEESDVFAFGMILRTILGLRRPSDGNADGSVNANDLVLQGQSFEPLQLSSGYRTLQDLSTDCTHPQRQRRPKFATIMDRLERMRGLSKQGDKFRPKLIRGRLSFQQPVAGAEKLGEDVLPSRKHYLISLPMSKLGAAGQMILRTNLFKVECGAFLVSSSHTDSQSLQLEAGVALEVYAAEFSKLPHCAMYGVGPGGPMVVCISKAKELYQEEPVYRVLIRSQSGDERCYIPASTKLLVPKKGQEGVPPTAAQLLSALRLINTKFEKCNFSVIRELASSLDTPILSEFEVQTVHKSFTFGILYAKAGQSTLAEMLANNSPSTEFESFLSSIGQVCKLNGYPRFAGGLDVQYDSTGEYSVSARLEECDIMFLVATMLPDDAAQRMRVRFLSRSISLLVFQDEDSGPLSPQLFADWPNVHVIVVVRPVRPRLPKAQMDPENALIESFTSKQSRRAKEYYQVAVASQNVVQPFGPHLENPVFERGQFLRIWLLSKLINGERACYRSDTKLRAKMEVTRATKLSQVELRLKNVQK